jgi:hypothetical protein
MNPARGKSCWQTGNLCAPLWADARPTSSVIHRTIGLDDDGCDVFVLGITLHGASELPGRAIRKVRSRILVVGPHVVKHTQGPELMPVRRGRFCNSVGGTARSLPGREELRAAAKTCFQKTGRAVGQCRLGCTSLPPTRGIRNLERGQHWRMTDCDDLDSSEPERGSRNGVFKVFQQHLVNPGQNVIELQLHGSEPKPGRVP